MALTITQAESDKVTYTFNVAGLGVNTISTAFITTLSGLTLTNISNDDASITVTVDSTSVSGRAVLDVVINLSNGDTLNRCINFTINNLCI